MLSEKEKVNYILEGIKKQIYRIIQDELTLENFEVILEKVAKYKGVVAAIKKVEDELLTEDCFELPDEKNQIEKKSERCKVSKKNENKECVASSDKSFNAPTYPLIRHLKGGFLDEIKAIVPEGAIRSIGAEDGDFLYAHKNPDGRYRYELAKKGESKKQKRVELQFGVVSKRDNMLLVEETCLNGGESIRLDDVLYSFRLQNNDVLEFDLSEGDIVDLAYYENNPTTVRVVWKHDTDKEEIKTPLKSGAYKDRSTDSGHDESETNSSLKGKTVMVLGCEPRKAAFEKAIKSSGGKFIWAEGTEGEDRLVRMVESADVVVILIKFIRHHASQFVVKTCKETCTNFTILDTLGIQSVVDGAICPQVIS